MPTNTKDTTQIMPSLDNKAVTISEVLMGLWHYGYNVCNVEKNHKDGYDNYAFEISPDDALATIEKLLLEAVEQSKPIYNSKTSRQYFQATPDHVKAHKNGYRLGVREFNNAVRTTLKAVLYGEKK